MVWTKIMNKLQKKKSRYESQEIPPINISRMAVQQALEEICENINFDILCKKTDVKYMNAEVLIIESVTLSSFDIPPVIAKKEEKKPSLWRRMTNRLLRK